MLRREILLASCAMAWLTGPTVSAGVFTNPLDLQSPEVGPVTSCADPTIIRSREEGDDGWYMYCTKDPLSGADRDAGGDLVFRNVPIFRSTDLVHWTYRGEVFGAVPSWGQPWSGLWAPEIQSWEGTYRLYYTMADVRDSISGEPGCGSDYAIGVATAPAPEGPWTDSGGPLVAPRRQGSGCNFATTIDPEVVTTPEGERYLLFGGYRGGIFARLLSPDGMVAPAATEVPVASDRFEGSEVFYRNGFYYLFVSPNGCCNGDLTGYEVMVGRSASPTGPFLDRLGHALDASRTGGTPVLAATGGPWLGPGHVSVFTDRAGIDWMLYHAVERSAPFFEGEPGFTRRPVLLDAIEWTEGWPDVRGGWWISTCSQPAPAAQPGQSSQPPDTLREAEQPGDPIEEVSDEFATGLGSQWSWIREPAPGTWSVHDGVLEMQTSPGELWEDTNDAPLLVEPAPDGEFVIETRVWTDVPAGAEGYDYVQAGLVIYGDDDRYIKLVVVATGGRRETEFAKEVPQRAGGWPRYGGTGIGPPGEWTSLRVVRRFYGGEELYEAYTRADGEAWVRGGTWTHRLGGGLRIGLAAMNRGGFTARFEDVRGWRLADYPCTDPGLADPCDRDGDGSGDRCDTDDDGDGLSDNADCDPVDPEAGVPPEVSGLGLAGADPTTLEWNAAPRADSYDMERGTAVALPSGDYGGCLADDIPETTLEDTGPPPPGASWTYLVRAADAACGGSGTRGTATAGGERGNTSSEACP